MGIPAQGTRQVTQILLNTAQNQSQTNLSLVRHSSTSSSQHASCEDQLRRKMLEKIIRVDHAGEMGASFIYQGQMAVLKNTKSRELIQEMWIMKRHILQSLRNCWWNTRYDQQC